VALFYVERGPLGIHPLVWRIPLWSGLITQTVLSTNDTGDRVTAGVLMAIAVTALHLVSTGPLRLRRAALVTTTVCGLAACYFAHNGTAEIPVYIAASRIPEVLDGRPMHWFTAADTAAVAVTIGYISGRIPLALVALGVPVLVQRAIEHRQLLRERDRAQALLAEVQAGREAETQAAALRERGRIARELHDVLAHTLAGLSVQLQAVRALASRQQVDEAVLAPIEKAATLAQDGLTEARAAVSALRDPVGLGLAELPALVERHPGAASLTVAGTPADVAPEAGHAVYRAVQEALTNAARYAPGSPVGVRLAWRPDALHVTVSDDGPAPDHDAIATEGTGLGLAGMGERLAQVGGTLHAGPDPHGGWRIELCVPTSVRTVPQ
jgi:signal transduction histidine kinase